MTLFDRYPVLGRRVSGGLVLLVLLFALVFSPPPVAAHFCGESAIEVSPGLYQYTITADVLESQPSDYEVIDFGDTNVVVIESPFNFSSFRVGQWTLRPMNPGTTTLKFRWTYSPNSAKDTCSVMVAVSPLPLITTSFNYHFSQSAGDPVNTLTGELTCQEPPDLDLGGPLPLFFARYYASGLRRTATMNEPLGFNWSHNFNAHMIRAGNQADVISSRGQRISFVKNGGVWELTGMSVLPYQLVEQGTNFVFGDPENRKLQTFDGAGRLTQIADAAGNTLTLTYVENALDQVSDGLGRTLIFQYSGFQRLSSVSDGTRTVNFNPFGTQLASVTDARGKLTQYNYDFGNPVQGLLTSKVLPRGNVPYTQQYDSQGRVSRQIVAGIGNYDFAYNGSNTLVTNPVGEVTAFVHNTNGALTSFTDATAENLTMQYNAEGLRSALIDREGRSTTYGYHAPSGFPNIIQHPDGRTFLLEYVGRTNVSGIVFYYVSKVTYEGGSMDQFFRDVAGNVTNWTDRAGRTISLAYNSKGQPTNAVDVLGRTLFVSYNTNGTLATFGLPAGSGFETSYSYDTLKRKTAVNRPDGSTLTFTYDAADHITQLKDERNNTRNYTFNDNGFVTQEVDAAGRTNLVAYDALDRVIGLTDPLGRTLGFAYDPAGNVTAVTHREGAVTRYGYDAANRLTSITNAAGFVTSYSRDGEGLLDGITDALNATTTLQKLADGNVTRVTSPLSNTVSAAYNRFGSLIGVTNAAGGVLLRTLDPTDLILSEQVGGVASATYTREPSGLLDGIVDGIGGVWGYPRGLLAEITRYRDPLGREVIYTNDVRGRIASMTFPGSLGWLQLSYSALDEITRLQYSDGVDVHFTNDAVGQLTGATGISQSFDAAGRMTNCNGLSIEWNEGQGMTNLIFKPGRFVQFAYDARGLVTNITDWAGGGVSVDYDATGRPMVMRRANGVHTTNTWNDEGMLTAIQEGILADIALVRDVDGNVAQATRNLPIAPVLAADEKTWSHDIASQISGYSFDALGRFVSDGVRTCSWDLASRLTNIAWGTNTIDCTFDALNYRLTRTENGMQAVCVWNYAMPLPTMSVVRMGGDDVRYFIYTPDGDLVYSIEADTNVRRYYHFDEVGNTMFLTDDAGAIVAAYAYSPFGEMLASTGSVPNPFTWQGRNGAFREGDSGLYYLRLRFYDGWTGRFLTRDLVHSMDPLRVNPYQYALNNPQRFVDPTGLEAIDGWGEFQGGVYTDGLRGFDNPIEVRALTGSKWGWRDERRLRLELEDVSGINVEFNPRVLSGFQFSANLSLSYTVDSDREPKIRRLERELRDLGQSLPPQRRMSMGGGWDAQDGNWAIAVGVYFGAVADDLIQPDDYSGGRTGQDFGDFRWGDPESRFDELARQLERCKRGPAPPKDVSNFNENFEYRVGGNIHYSGRNSLRFGLSYQF